MTKCRPLACFHEILENIPEDDLKLLPAFPPEDFTLEKAKELIKLVKERTGESL